MIQVKWLKNTRMKNKMMRVNNMSSNKSLLTRMQINSKIPNHQDIRVLQESNKITEKL